MGSSQKMKLSITSPSGRVLAELDVDGKRTVSQLKNEFRSKQPKYSVDRQRFTLKTPDGTTVALEDDEKSLSQYGIKDGDKLNFKDLGPQIGWQTVFFIEYLGPLLIYLPFYLHRSIIYGSDSKPSVSQELAFYGWTFHYGKRLFETLFIHRFSHGTMPIRNLFKNCSYYWGFAGVVAYFVNYPYSVLENSLTMPAFVAFMLFELCNGYTHIQLRNLRPAGSKKRAIPRGFAFEYVSCPNYLFEILAWTSFTVLTQSIPALLFALAGAVQMWFWAVKKHKQYRKEFPDYPRRKVLIPFVL